MIYLKEFSTENDYLAYRNDKNKYIKPNVSLCDGNNTVYYNYPPPPDSNGHDYVDLGLPSGTLWATMNVGASKPSDYGLYFQWGDTSGYTEGQVGTVDGKKEFRWKDYKWSIDGSDENFSKYKQAGDALELADDAANANMGGSWHMPTPEQIQELISNTDTGWTTSNGTGMTFTSKSDTSKSIFIPAAGYAWDGSVQDSGSRGSVWSSLPYTYSVGFGQGLYFSSNYVNLNADGRRCDGRSVRGVLG